VEPTTDPTADLFGPWRPVPIPLADSQVAVVSDACAAAARDQLGDAEADLPTAVVDARGEGLVTAILSDGDRSIDCVAHFDGSGTVVAVDSIDRLSVATTDAVEGSGVSIVELQVIDDAAGQRTIAFGRIGPGADGVIVPGVQDVRASSGASWWATCWSGKSPASSLGSVNQAGTVLTSAPIPPNGVESRLTSASWWLDPRSARPSTDAESLHVLVREEACASGQSGADRVEPPAIDLTETSIAIRLDVRQLSGAQDCGANPPFPFVIQLPEARGDRTLLDAGTRPPREPTEPAPGG